LYFRPRESAVAVFTAGVMEKHVNPTLKRGAKCCRRIRGEVHVATCWRRIRGESDGSTASEHPQVAMH
jgi:hypothetical protein